MMQRRTKRAIHADLERLTIVLYHHPTRQQQAVVKATELREREEALAEEKKKLGMTD
jgi:pre-mRNA branch site protein p14